MVIGKRKPGEINHGKEIHKRRIMKLITIEELAKASKLPVCVLEWLERGDINGNGCLVDKIYQTIDNMEVKI